MCVRTPIFTLYPYVGASFCGLKIPLITLNLLQLLLNGVIILVHSNFPSEQLLSGMVVCFCSLVLLLTVQPYG
jgi:hypothetical protein